jgi:hypothetical protein
VHLIRAASAPTLAAAMRRIQTTNRPCHCEERSDEATSVTRGLECASLYPAEVASSLCSSQ